MIRFLSILAILAPLFASSQAQLNKQLSSLVDSIQTDADYPGIVFAYVTPDGKVHSVPGGWADKENEIKMSKDHRLHSGSTGKTIVSALVMQLVEENLIDLDKTMKSYLGDYSWFDQLPNSDSITVRHLLQHSSGIQRYEFKDAFIEEVNKDLDKVWKPEELVYYVLGDEPLFSAGGGFSYADTNYILAGMIIEKVTGESFYSLAYERVLKPLNLTSFVPTSSNKIPNMAQGYFDEASEYALGFKSPFLVGGKNQNNMQWEWTGGGYAYQTHEYAQLLKSIYEGEVFDMEKVGDDFFGMIESAQIGGMYGLGVHQLTFPNRGRFIGHGGFFPGYNTIGLYHPDTKLSFAMQINSTNLPHLQRFYRDYLQLVDKVIEAYAGK